MEENNKSAMYDEEFGVDLSDVFREDGGADQTDEIPENDDTPAEEPEPVETAEEPAQQEDDQTQQYPQGARRISKEAELPRAAQQEQPEQTSTEEFLLKHMDQTFTVDRQKVTELAQKGLDYERIRQQREEFKQQRDELEKFRAENADMVEFINELSRESGMTTEQLIDELRANQYVRKQGISQDVARERVAREKAERRLQARERQDQKKQQMPPADPEKQRRQEDIRAFFQRFPGVDPKTIDKSVWQGVSSGKSLVDSYQDWQNAQKDAEIQRLKAQIEADRKNQENRSKSIGSQRSGSQEDSRDKFLDALLSD